MRYRGLSFRTEQKYYLHLHDYLTLRNNIAQVLRLDQHTVNVDGYNIRSLYFDDPRRTSIETKNDGIYKRQKFRIRIYNDSDEHIMLERKNKLGDYVAKEGVKITREQYDEIIKGNYDCLYTMQNNLALDFYASMTSYGYKPTVIVDYWREAYIYPQGNVRITFDKKLAVVTNQIDVFHRHLSFSEIIQPGLTIMEVKYDHVLPNSVRLLLSPAKSLRSSISKYVLCQEKKMLLHTQ